MGLGAGKAKNTIPARMKAAAAKIKGPARAGTPMDVANSPVTSTMLGPATAPKVVETIAILIAFARWLGLAKSVPA